MNTELSQFTAVIGIDWADTKHDICVQASDSDTRVFSRISHKVEKIDEGAEHGRVDVVEPVQGLRIILF